MPRSLRWFAAVTSGFFVQVLLSFIVGAILTRGGSQTVEVTQRDAGFALLQLGEIVLNVLIALAVNDWLAARYPREKRRPAAKTPALEEPERAL